MRLRRCGFTLLEMLVIIVVIGVLGAMILPLSRARQSERRSSCGNNVGNMIKCCHLYSDAGPNLGMFPLYGSDTSANGLKSLNLLYNAYVKDHRVFSCVTSRTNTSAIPRFTGDQTTMSSWMTPQQTHYGYDPGHTPVHATAGVVGDYGTLHATNHWNSTNHGPEGPGQNVGIGAGSVEWWDVADKHPTKNANGSATTDDIYADDLDPVKFPEELETNILR